MISSSILADAVRELHEITGIDICLVTRSGQIIADCFSQPEYFSNQGKNIQNDIDRLFAADNNEDSIDTGSVTLTRPDAGSEYILITGGDNRDVAGKIAASEIAHIIEASHEKNDKSKFIRDLLLDNVLPADIADTARRLRLRDDVTRTVYIVETAADDSSAAREMLQAIFASPSGSSFVIPLEDGKLAVVTETNEKKGDAGLSKTAMTIADMLNAEAMIQVRVSYGMPVNRLSHLSQSCKEARLAGQVGKIFYPDRRVIPYDRLGIGRLIYQLPRPLCELFLKETFDHDIFSELDEETLSTINHFFDNNLNISETARQLYIHRNTLVYRIEKLQKLCGLDIRKFEDAMTFKIAMMVNANLNSESEN